MTINFLMFVILMSYHLLELSLSGHYLRLVEGATARFGDRAGNQIFIPFFKLSAWYNLSVLKFCIFHKFINSTQEECIMALMAK